MSQSRNGLKLLVIGIDGATFDVIRPMIDHGELPNLAKLIHEGVSGELESTIPPYSAPAWATFMTGVNPAKHGVMGFVNYNTLKYTYQDFKHVNSSLVAGQTIFDFISQAGQRVAAITVPVTYPSWPINGFMVTGSPTPDNRPGFAYPPEFERSLPGRYTFPSGFWSSASNGEIAEGGYQMVRRRCELATKLLAKEDLDMMTVVFGATDRAHHNFWRYYDREFGQELGLPEESDFSDVIPRTYRLADDAVGKLLTYVQEDTTVLVISDHGGGRISTNHVHINAWLNQLGLLNVNKGQAAVAGPLRTLLGKARRSMGRNMEHRLRASLPPRFIEQGRGVMRNVAQIDWSRTKAYRFPMYHPAEGIVVNVRGRQEAGIVEMGCEYDDLREMIIAEALKLIDPFTGMRIVERAYKREELYHGPHIERTPDIVLMLSDRYDGGLKFGGPLVTPVSPERLLALSGQHRLDGILLARGPKIKRGDSIRHARLVDIAPTILYCMGFPVARHMDGVVLQDVFEPAYLAAHPVQYTEDYHAVERASPDLDYTAEEREQIEAQLRRLGYLE